MNKLLQKTTFLFGLVWLSACNSQTIRAENTESAVAGNQKKLDSNDITQSACELCIIECEIREAERFENLYDHSNYKNACDSMLTVSWRNHYDSLKRTFEFRIKEFKNDIYFAEEKCSKRYPIHYVKNERIRDSLLFLLDVWENIPRPRLSDTTCYEPNIENGKYIIKDRGKAYLLTKEEHDRAIQNFRKGFNHLESYIASQKLELLQQLSGDKNPDIYFRDILRRYAKHISKTKNLDPQSDAPPEILDEFTRLAQKAGKLEY